MKNILLVMTLLSTACGSSDLNSSNTLDVNPLNIKLSRDSRPVDGPLVEILIQQNALGNVDVKRHTVSFDRINHKEVESFETIADGLLCNVTKTVITCSKDQRNADGIYLEIKAVKQATGKYNVNKKTIFFDRISRKMVKNSQLIETDLMLKK